MHSLRLQKTRSLPTLDGQLAAAWFAAPSPARPTKQEKAGRSPLVGVRCPPDQWRQRLPPSRAATSTSKPSVAA